MSDWLLIRTGTGGLSRDGVTVVSFSLETHWYHNPSYSIISPLISTYPLKASKTLSFLAEFIVFGTIWNFVLSFLMSVSKEPAPRYDWLDFHSGEDDSEFIDVNAVEYLTLTSFAESISLEDKLIIFGA